MVHWKFVERNTVNSTQLVAKEEAVRGAPEGTTIVARSQTSGTGRLGRHWVSPPGGLYMSFILRPRKLPRPELASLVTAAAVVDGVRQTTGIEPKVRWPNDVMAGAKKLGGVIAEAESQEGAVNLIVVGVGVNCNASPSQMEAVQPDSTSLAMELGTDVSISKVRQGILDSFSLLYDRWDSGEDLQAEWISKVRTVGREVSIKLKTGENPFSCVAEAIDGEGNLVVILDGESVAVNASDLEWLRERA